MSEALGLPAASARVLEIGTGSGYQAAVLAAMGAQVLSVERCPRWRAAPATSSRSWESATGCGWCDGDGTLGWPGRRAVRRRSS